ncbi:virulence protein RhuM/Fic/DOC family protein [Pasteurella multocida]|uniref:virulence protein RhuM/Fic/DOC family protein n=1 Tax=Pasteurella multocida TaxID=747 RepID=UPI00061A70E8|nr:virulence protein RhuM/Fic/DOC family protein [Pasteurella multocida]AKD40851.1 Death-on-curing protein [Pasteurella multocida OH1905]QHZ98587.1 virulence protein RhuM/Fic/DOC family protein [Pasteurella multocida]URJ90991.1 virulence protein RhuM/Fic/DOC family protein [Pasteurella multocida]WND44024.1 virulence protein RhuM/Fic/DOC family protein [Pasteurella multocida]WRK05126.1 virulence protein RhuM/Fic/DOC family protein [Pasteurella multocida]
MNNQIQLYTSEDGKIALQVSFEQETVWLTQAQMAELFTKDVRTINEHIGNVFSEGELERDPTIRKFRIVRQEGNRQVSREIEHYNLDMIISVGYRVKSKRGVQFRQWATQTLKQFLVQGYAINERRLQEKGIEFSQAVALLSRTLTNQALVNDNGQAVISVVQDYARTWSLLQAYDEQSLVENRVKQPAMKALVFDEVLQAIEQLKQTLIEKGEATALFGQQRSDGLASAIATIEQGFGEEWFYPNIASRAAHLLYFVIKNHPFADGNKRTGSFLFLWYLRLNQGLLAKPVEQLINDNTLVALALLVAESLPEQKALMIKLIEHFILLKTHN